MLAALASLGLSAPKEATIDSTLAAPNVAAAQHEEKWTPTQHEKHWTPAQHEKYVELGMTKQVKADQCTSLKQMQDEHTLKMAQAMTEIELRWTRGGYFDNLYLSPKANKWLGAKECSTVAVFSLHLLLQIRDQCVSDLGVLPGSTPETSPHKIRYFPSDSLLPILYGCTDHVNGHDCSNHTLAALDPCPAGSSKMLVDSEFSALKSDPRFSCIRTIPNKYQRSGFAAEKAWDAWKLTRGTNFENRKQKALYVGKALPDSQRSNLLNHTNWYTKGMPITDWLVTPESMDRSEAVKYRYQIDIGGSSGTTWDALMWKMASGALVFKVKHQAGAQDHWHNEMVNNKHYLEVDPDLSNLHDKWQWAESNPGDANRIARSGQELALQWASKEYAGKVLEKVLRKEFNFPSLKEDYPGA